MKRLLIISCSARKFQTAGPTPALDVYDGGTYRVIRKLQRSGHLDPAVEIIIISALYGCLRPHDRIVTYDLMLKGDFDPQLRRKVEKRVKDELKKNWSEVYVDLGAKYRALISGALDETTNNILFANGRIGQRLRLLKLWCSIGGGS
jgi:cytoplasmic iron level regulating protein YaaA (DUF328/UPF0246 family)